jgi:predicted metal-dependent phosphoesterase TrpH
MIDLHTHTDRSDGSTPPGDLLRQAAAEGLQALAIADHDTLAGYDAASPVAADCGVELVCAVELSTRPNETRQPGKRERSIHVLGYWLSSEPTVDFRRYLETQQASRRKRNVDLVAKLQQLGVSITLEDAEVYGRNQVGRPHFARVLLEKGYVTNMQQAFDVYLADEAQAGVDRDEPTLDEGIRRIKESGGIASAAAARRGPGTIGGKSFGSRPRRDRGLPQRALSGRLRGVRRHLAPLRADSHRRHGLPWR